jgi:hypothetical protein
MQSRQLQDQEKSLENTIQALGLALGTGAIVASSSGLMTLPWRSPWDSERYCIRNAEANGLSPSVYYGFTSQFFLSYLRLLVGKTMATVE